MSLEIGSFRRNKNEKWIHSVGVEKVHRIFIFFKVYLYIFLNESYNNF